MSKKEKIVLSDKETYAILDKAKKQMSHFEKIMATRDVLPPPKSLPKNLYDNFTWEKPLKTTWDIPHLRDKK